jgi:hypothetical protein
MKIFKLADNQWSDEGHDSVELPDAETFEAKQQLEKKEIGATGETFTAHVLSKFLSSGIGQSIPKSYFTANGSVGWLKFDGIIYEVAISPARWGNHYDLFKRDESSNPSPADQDEI